MCRTKQRPAPKPNFRSSLRNTTSNVEPHSRLATYPRHTSSFPRGRKERIAAGSATEAIRCAERRDVRRRVRYRPAVCVFVWREGDEEFAVSAMLSARCCLPQLLVCPGFLFFFSFSSCCSLQSLDQRPTHSFGRGRCGAPAFISACSSSRT